MTFAEKVNAYNRRLNYTGTLPEGIRIMNPFRENDTVLPTSKLFYDKFYSDEDPRKLILGINPGRLGAGTTGIPFTDTKRLSSFCKIEIKDRSTHEPSSVFIYDMIHRYGGTERFYKDHFINSVCPLGFIRLNDAGKWVNCNYYDYPELVETVTPFMLSNLKKLVALGIDSRTCYVLGKKNALYVERLNKGNKFFEEIKIIEHPRYIEQYRSKQRDEYIDKYLALLGQ